MASVIIHLAIAKKVKEKLKLKENKDYYLGAIAPDISKQIGEDKEQSHFLINTKKNIPNLSLFIKRYPFFSNNPFQLGYFIHLFTDKLWYEEFLPQYRRNDFIKLQDGTSINVDKDGLQDIIYSDYSNLNIQIIDEYHLDLSLFYEEFTLPKTTFLEIPIEKLDILLNKTGIIIENSKEEKKYTFHFRLFQIFFYLCAVLKEVTEWNRFQNDCPLSLRRRRWLCRRKVTN